MRADPDLLLVGGGLANGLIAWRLSVTHPDLSIMVLEGGERLGGNHTWSFHTGDLTAGQHQWLAPLVTRSWSSHEVRFPSYWRRIAGGYHCATSERFHHRLQGDLGDRVQLGAPVDRVGPNEVHLRDGRVIRSNAIIDGRGFRDSHALELAYQKFLGLEVALEDRHELEGPILIDATVKQRDGFRFLYTLPLTDRNVLVEDTRYSDAPDLEVEELRRSIRTYCEERGWRISSIDREEQGILPIVLSGDFEALWSEATTVPASGVRAGLFHHTTGYSLPEAVRLADELSRHRSFTSAGLHAMIHARSSELWRRQRYFRLLNRMMFRAADPDHRYRVLEHFYRLPEAAIERFYSGRLSWWDRVRILSGRPPVPIGRALRCMVGS